MKKNKKGLLGSIIELFFATIAIIIILVLFALASGVISSIKTPDISIDDETVVGINNVFVYSDNYVGLTKARTEIVRGNEIDEAIANSNYVEGKVSYDKR